MTSLDAAIGATGGGPRTYVLSPYIHWVPVEDIVFVLDEANGWYFGLDRPDAELWTALLESKPVQARPGDDAFGRLIEDASRRGWLLAADSVQPPSRVRPMARRSPSRPSLPKAYAALVRAYWSVSWLGFARAYAWARSATTVERHRSGMPAVEQGTRLFMKAESLILSRRGLEDCLPRSLALFVFLRRAGFAVRHHIGVRAYPFAAHAWVEHDEVPLLDAPHVAHRFIPIATIV